MFSLHLKLVQNTQERSICWTFHLVKSSMRYDLKKYFYKMSSSKIIQGTLWDLCKREVNVSKYYGRLFCPIATAVNIGALFHKPHIF